MRSSFLISACFLAASSSAAGEPWDFLAVHRILATAASPDGDAAWIERAVTGKAPARRFTFQVLRTADGRPPVRWATRTGELSNLALSDSGVWFLEIRDNSRLVYRVREPMAPPEQMGGRHDVTRFAVSPDGKQLAWLEAGADQGPGDGAALWLRSLAPMAEPRRLTDRRFDPHELAWRPDSRAVALRASPGSRGKAELVEFDVGRRSARALTETTSTDRSPIYSPDSRRLAFTRANEEGRPRGAARVFVVERRNRKARPLGDTPNQGPALVGWSPDGRTVYATDRVGTTQVLYAFASKGDRQEAYRPERGFYHSESWAKGRLVLAEESAKHPPEVYSVDLASGKRRQLSAANGGLPDLPCGRTTRIHWAGADGTAIEGLLTEPAGYDRGRRYPLAVLLHGGPADLFPDDFVGGNPLFPVAELAARGFFVLRVNPRGSNGYGPEFRNAIVGDWGGADAADVLAGIDRLAERGLVFGDRVAVAGWSYGGYLAIWLAGHSPKIRAVAAGAPMTELTRLHVETILPGLLERYLEGTPDDNPQAYAERSPLNFAARITAPVLLMHGEQDLQVPVTQSTSLYDALIRRGVAVSMRIYPEMAHEPALAETLADVGKRQSDWLTDALTRALRP